MSRQSLYYCGQLLYFTSLWGWSIMFLKRSRAVPYINYFLAALVFLTGTYIFDYHTFPTTKHVFWYLSIISTGLGLGAMLFQWNYMFYFDIMYMLANSMSFVAVLSYYSTFPHNSSLLLTSAAATSGMLYSLGFLRIIRCG